ncbi:MAG TPA: tRNA dihydrouridine(20/20a) synthase DusA [Pelagibacteraceae bacterium]|jgi:tRNA-dihydrouridine synthase A|nr:tRNA dihydrouridine(20/20a) synthase DusA [Pelagibacteraceae bacterium]|tara:strand:+ start:595 stop:1581 length:987 start_codon:yes stop_codon:yes gene_type:complete
MKKTVLVAPMMDCTDRHDRYFLRLISKNVILYTEMIVANAIIKGDKDFHLKFNLLEKPLALQIAGSNPKELAQATRIAADYGYDEINLNLGCPSKKVQKNKFGACMMKEPNLVGDCITEMVNACNLPISIKTRIGFDDYEDYEYLKKFISIIREAGSKTFILHARRAILNKLTPKQNLSIPPLNYNFVYNLKKDFNNDTIILNGGIDSVEKINAHFKKVDGVMIGRAAYHSPYFLADIEREIFNNNNVPTRSEVMEKMLPYIHYETKKGTRLNQIMRHTIGLFHGQKGSTQWKRYLSKNMCIREADLQKINHIIDHIKNDRIATFLGK